VVTLVTSVKRSRDINGDSDAPFPIFAHVRVCLSGSVKESGARNRQDNATKGGRQHYPNLMERGSFFGAGEGLSVSSVSIRMPEDCSYRGESAVGPSTVGGWPSSSKNLITVTNRTTLTQRARLTQT
jgi:hypothetical protein